MDNGETYKTNETDVAEMDVIGTEVVNYQDSIEIIRKELDNIKQSFLTIGWYLKYIKDRELYRNDGYVNINDFAKDKFNMSQSNVSRYINLCERFSAGNGSPKLNEKYKGFDYSQLTEMLPMKPEDQEKVTPDMTVKQIREMKRQEKEKNRKDSSVSIKNDASEEIYATSHNDNMEKIFLAIRENQPELPELKKSKERKAWLENVEAWGLWYEDPNIQSRYYKYDFSDGSRLIATKYRYTCPPYMKEQPEQYREQIEADGSYYGTPVYHMIYSEDYWEEHMDEYREKYERYYTHDIAEIPELEKFLNWVQGSRDYSDVRYVEFDTTHLGEDENKDQPFITRQYIKFYSEHGYIPRCFNVKNRSEIKDYAPTLTTSSGSFSGIGSVVFFSLLDNIVEVMENETLSQEEQENAVVKLLRIASPKEREEAEKEVDRRLIERAEQEKSEIGIVRFKVSKLSVEDCFRLMGMKAEDVEEAKKVGVSDAQLYKQAGNGIVTNCVGLLMEHLYQAQYDSSYVCTDEEMNLNNKDASQKKK